MTPSVREIIVKEFSADVGVSREIFAKHYGIHIRSYKNGHNPILWFLEIIQKNKQTQLNRKQSPLCIKMFISVLSMILKNYRIKMKDTI